MENRIRLSCKSHVCEFEGHDYEATCIVGRKRAVARPGLHVSGDPPDHMLAHSYFPTPPRFFQCFVTAGEGIR